MGFSPMKSESLAEEMASSGWLVRAAQKLYTAKLKGGRVLRKARGKNNLSWQAIGGSKTGASRAEKLTVGGRKGMSDGGGSGRRCYVLCAIPRGQAEWARWWRACSVP